MTGLSRPLLRAWAWLTGLSLAAALATLAPVPPWAVAAATLLLALAKARLILARYLDLARAPCWLSGTMLVLALWAALAFALYAAPALTP
ncbi:nitric oxide reductase F protein [Psychromarinibacter sp. C21-152]|uniref:Nitric oxide reductase F protein n=1 Tax=Psychromarinibacter sediminicola TaxID=3033385 RepID=A0AAE3TB88_9RHOB|nr:cytochrome C oxidase subunit IV family protein [Psychromarinibacter sediminicola]MDF0602425.1 nitric oxide reductase F protein [Psychromarinibacter sediminicola]